MYPYHAVVRDDTDGTTVFLYEERVPSSDYRRIYKNCLSQKYFPIQSPGEISGCNDSIGNRARHKSCVESVARAYATKLYGESFTRQIMVTFEDEDQYFRTHFSVQI